MVGGSSSPPKVRIRPQHANTKENGEDEPPKVEIHPTHQCKQNVEDEPQNKIRLLNSPLFTETETMSTTRTEHLLRGNGQPGAN